MENSSIGRRRFLGYAGASLSVGLLAPHIARAQPAKEIRIAHHLSVESDQHAAALFFSERVKEKSGGSLNVTVFPAAQMGGGREIVESVSLGVVEMGYGESGLYAGYELKFGVVALPYLYKDFAHWERAMDGAIGQDLASRLETKGNMKIVSWLTGGYRSTFLRTKAINAPADFGGVKIRLPESPTFVRTFAALGASPTPIPAPEMYAALQSGVVDAMEGSLETGFTYRIYEVCKNLSLTKHILNDGSWVMNTGFFGGLTPEEQKVITDVGLETATYQRKIHFERYDVWLERLKTEGGIASNEPNLAPFQEMLAPLHDEFAKEFQAADVLEAIRAA